MTGYAANPLTFLGVQPNQMAGLQNMMAQLAARRAAAPASNVTPAVATAMPAVASPAPSQNARQALALAMLQRGNQGGMIRRPQVGRRMMGQMMGQM